LSIMAHLYSTLFGQGFVLQHVLPQSGVPFFVNQLPGGVAYPIMLGVGLQPYRIIYGWVNLVTSIQS